MNLPQLFTILGLTVLHMLWIGALIGGVAFVMLQLTRKSDPRARHACAVVGLAALLVGTVTTIVFLTATTSAPGISLIDATGPSTPDDLQLRLETTAPASHPATGTTEPRLATISMIAWGWIAGIVIMSIRLASQWLKVRRLRVIGVVKAQPRWVKMFETLKSQIGVHPRLTMMVSHTIDAPMVVGWLQPLVLVPATAFSSLTPEQMRMVLTHELQHIARRDHLVNMLQAFIEVLLFFHPVTWWLSRQIRIERENCCDDGTVNLTGSPRTFAEALLVLESLRTEKTNPLQILTATGGSLMNRVTRLFGSNQPQPLNVGWRSLSACTVLAAAGLAFSTAAIEPTAVAQDRRVVDTEKLDLDQLKTRIEERIRTMGEDLRRQVAAGEISEADAKNRFKEGERRMWMRYRAAEEKQIQGEKIARSDYETAVEKMTEMVEAGKITRKQMQQRLERMKKQVASSKTEQIDLVELKAKIEERVRGLGMNLREQVAAGEISEADARVKFAEGEKRMWERYRVAEEKQRNERKDAGAGNRSLEELKAKIEERVRGLGMNLREQVAAGEISEADARVKFAEGEKRMWERYRVAEEKQRNERKDAGAGNRSLEELKAKIEERVRGLGMNLREQVAAGEISEADARVRFAEGEKRMWERYRAAEEKVADGERRTPGSEYDAAVEKMTEMVEDGRITRKQMQQRLDRMKQSAD